MNLKGLFSFCSALVLGVAGLQAQTQTFNYQGNLFQTYTVPVTGWYLLDASGAQGGRVHPYEGGKGARMQGYVQLQAGDVLRIAVGGAGGPGEQTGSYYSGGGGGGGSSIVKVKGTDHELLIIAGGGGGAYQSLSGSPGLATRNGGLGKPAGSRDVSAAAGADGGGGDPGSPEGPYSPYLNFRGGAGGAGYLGDGGTVQDTGLKLAPPPLLHFSKQRSLQTLPLGSCRDAGYRRLDEGG